MVLATARPFNVALDDLNSTYPQLGFSVRKMGFCQRVKDGKYDSLRRPFKVPRQRKIMWQRSEYDNVSSFSY